MVNLESRSRIHEAVQYIENRLNAPITIEDVCHAGCYSKYHFQRLFHAATGVTIAEYIQTRRVTECARKLLHTNESILQISLEYQFKSHQHFSRAFRKLFGVTPSQFRKTGIANAPKLFEPFTVDDIPEDLDKNGMFLRIVDHPEEKIYLLEAESNDPLSVHRVWGEMRERYAGERVLLKGMISYPEQVTLEYNYKYSVIAPKPREGLKEITLPQTSMAEFRYVGSIQNLPNLYRYIYCVWMDREGYMNPHNFDLEFPTENFHGPDHDANEMIVQIPVQKI